MRGKFIQSIKATIKPGWPYADEFKRVFRNQINCRQIFNENDEIVF